MADKKQEIPMTHKVVTDTGVLHSEHPSEAQAKARATMANQDAKALGLTVTYSVKEV